MNHTKTEPTEHGHYIIVGSICHGLKAFATLNVRGWWVQGNEEGPGYYGLPDWPNIEFIGPLVPLADSPPEALWVPYGKVPRGPDGPPEPSWTAWGGVPTCDGRWLCDNNTNVDGVFVTYVSEDNRAAFASLSFCRFYGPIPEPAEDVEPEQSLGAEIIEGLEELAAKIKRQGGVELL